MPFKPKLITLPNKATVLLIQDSKSPTVLLDFFVHIGSRFEKKSEMGLSHVLEHMLFKGSQKYPTPFAVSTAVDSLGANYNASTDKEITSYHAQVSARHLDKTFDIFSDIFLRPKFMKAEYEREKKVIVEELKMYYENPASHIGDLADEAFYGDNPMGWNVGGTAKAVLGFSHQALLNYYKKYYIGANATLVVAGKFNEKKILALAKKSIGQLPSGKKAVAVPAPKIKQNFVFDDRKLNQVNLVMGWERPGGLHKDDAIYSFLATLLGGMMSSRLFMAIREKRGLCYSIRTSQNLFVDSGHFNISAGLDRARIKKAVKAIWRELEMLKEIAPDKKEMQKILDFKLGKQDLALRTVEDYAGWYAGQYMSVRKWRTPAEWEKMLKKVTAKDIQKLAQKMFKPSTCVVAAIGSKLKKSDFNS